MRVRRAAALLAVLLVAVLAVVAGCGGGSDGGGGGDVTVPLGTARTYTGTEQWNYSLTGTYTPNAGGAQAISPATATLTYSGIDQTVGGIAGCRLMTLTVPITIGSDSWTETFVIAVKQAADASLQLVGIDCNAGIMGALDTPIAGPDPDNLGGTGSWGGSTDADFYGEFEIDCDNQGVEKVSTGGEVYECYKVTGTKSVGGFPSNFTLWLNPATGAFVRMTNSYTDILGTTTFNYALSSTNFTP